MVIIKLIFIGTILITLFIICLNLFIHKNDPPKSGCEFGKHKWECIHDERGYSGYTQWSKWKLFKCKKCGKEEKTSDGIW